MTLEEREPGLRRKETGFRVERLEFSEGEEEAGRVAGQVVVPVPPGIAVAVDWRTVGTNGTRAGVGVEGEPPPPPVDGVVTTGAGGAVGVAGI
ncbi:MAG: hypothetical protein WCT19_02925, partial [Candidatus Paceibacterota bacterium]